MGRIFREDIIGTRVGSKNPERPARRAMERFFALADDAMIILDPDGTVRHANESCRVFLAGPERRLEGRRLHDFAVGADAGRLDAAVQAAIDGGHKVRVDVKVRDVSGRVRLCRLALVCDTDTRAGGQRYPESVYVVARDITDEEERYRSTERILDAAPNATFVCDTHGDVTYANAAADALFGYSSGQLVGMNVDQLVPPELRVAHRQQREHITGRATLHQQHVMGRARYVSGVTADGQRIELDVTLTFVTIRGARHVVASVVDIHAQKALERQLREARDSALALAQAKSQVLANTSHEIRTPLTSVLGVADLLLDTPLNPDQRQMVETLRSAGNHLLSLVNDILVFARAESGRMDVEELTFNPLELVNECMRLVQPQLAGKSIETSVDVYSEIPVLVTGDREKLRGILINLLGNAAKFTEAGQIVVSVCAGGGNDIKFAVSDTGIGIADTAIAGLFEPFVQADSSTTRVFGGSGLGLAISDQLARTMGGRIEARSTPGQGSRFTLTVPLPPAQGPAPVAKRAHQELPPPMRVLLVEDQRVNSMIMRRMLVNLDMTVTQAYDGNEAIAQLRAHPFDVVLMDCHMPDVDGFEATRRIRAGEGDQSQVPIVALTASALEEDRLRCLAVGMDDFVSKPTSPDELQEVLARVSSAGNRPRPHD